MLTDGSIGNSGTASKNVFEHEDEHEHEDD
jgi:hypothetical protein